MSLGSALGLLLAMGQASQPLIAPPGLPPERPAAYFVDMFVQICLANDGNLSAQQAAGRKALARFPIEERSDGTVRRPEGASPFQISIGRDARQSCGVRGFTSDKIDLDGLSSLISERLKVAPSQSGLRGKTPIDIWPEASGPGSGTVLASLETLQIILTLWPFQKAPQ